MQYTKLLKGRALSVKIEKEKYYGFLGIRDFTQNLRINYKNILKVPVSETELEELLDTKDPLRSIGLEIVDRQSAVTPGNIIDLLCKDAKGDYVVVELKRRSANETIGQLARYVTDVKENKAKAGQKVTGLILTLEVDEQLIKAARGVDFDVVLCQLTLG
jgi:RecB family endonuclease NucS